MDVSKDCLDGVALRNAVLAGSKGNHIDGVAKILHPLRCYNFSNITTYPMCSEMREKLYASTMKLFTYPSTIDGISEAFPMMNESMTNGYGGQKSLQIVTSQPRRCYSSVD